MTIERFMLGFFMAGAIEAIDRFDRVQTDLQKPGKPIFAQHYCAASRFLRIVEGIVSPDVTPYEHVYMFVDQIDDAPPPIAASWTAASMMVH